MVNITNIDKVIEKIRDENNFFSMMEFYIDPSEWSKDVFAEFFNAELPRCETPACIGGWTEHVMSKEPPIKDFYYTLENSYEWLGLKIEDEDDYLLFYPTHKAYHDITRQEAIDVLERLKETGKVSWS